MNEQWHIIEKALKEHSISSVSCRMVIESDDNGRKAEHEMYLKVGWFNGCAATIDITLSRFSSFDGFGDLDAMSAILDNVYRASIENSRSFLEVVCRHATAMLQSGVWNLGDVVDVWIATKNMIPCGHCEAVKTELGTIVTSPLDAAAKLIRKNRERWETQARKGLK